jgi:hypothetical protein
MAINTIINAYSTIPCPFSLGENNIDFPPFLQIFLDIEPKLAISYDISIKKSTSICLIVPNSYAKAAAFVAGN